MNRKMQTPTNTKPKQKKKEHPPRKSEARSRSPRSPWLKNGGNQKTADNKTATPSSKTNTHLNPKSPLILQQFSAFCAETLVGIGCSSPTFPICNVPCFLHNPFLMWVPNFTAMASRVLMCRHTSQKININIYKREGKYRNGG